MEEISILVSKNTAMAAMCNAMNLYGLFKVYSATFFGFLLII